MTEISYLIDLLLNHKLPKSTRENIRARIQLLEKGIPASPQRSQAPQPTSQQPTVVQSQVAAQALADRAAVMNAAGGSSPPNSVFKTHK